MAEPKKKKGGRAVSDADAKRGGRAMSSADARKHSRKRGTVSKTYTIEEEAAQRRKRRKELDAEMSPHRRALSQRMRRNSLKYNMSAPDHRKMSGPELTVPKKAKGGSVKKYAHGVASVRHGSKEG